MHPALLGTIFIPDIIRNISRRGRERRNKNALVSIYCSINGVTKQSLRWKDVVKSGSKTNVFVWYWESPVAFRTPRRKGAKVWHFSRVGGGTSVVVRSVPTGTHMLHCCENMPSSYDKNLASRKKKRGTAVASSVFRMCIVTGCINLNVRQKWVPPPPRTPRCRLCGDSSSGWF